MTAATRKLGDKPATAEEICANVNAAMDEIERRRAGLDGGMPLWVIVDEHNVDVFEQSFFIEPQSQIGAFSSAFTKPTFPK